VDVIGVSKVPGPRRLHDGVRAEAVKAIGSVRTSGASRCAGWRWLEKLPCVDGFGRGRGSQFAANLDKREASTQAQGKGDEFRKINRGSALPMAPKSSGYTRRYCGLRRGIPPAWRHNQQQREGEKERRLWPSYRRGAGKKRQVN
jgi:hypothetical protein